MFAEKIKYFVGYVRVRLTGYAPERFLNLCSNHNILIWNLIFTDGNYEFCISLQGFRKLKPILRKTKTRVIVLEKFGLPFFMHHYRKRKIFFGGIALCGVALYIMSLFIWNIEVQGNLHRTDGAIIKFLEENSVYHGIYKRKLDCVALEELLRTEFDDIIWASVKIQGTRLVIDIQENLVTNKEKEVNTQDTPMDLVADKDGEIYSIFTRQGMPYVEKGTLIKKGDIIVEGKIPVYNDIGEVYMYKYCCSDADVLAVTTYSYENNFSMEYEDKNLTGNESINYYITIFQKKLNCPLRKEKFVHCDTVTEEIPLKLGENFYLPITIYKETAKEYKMEMKKYTIEEAKALAENKLQEFCEKLEQKGVQIIENNVIIVTEGNSCVSKGELKIIEPIGVQQPTTIIEIPQEGQMTDESDGNNH